MAIISLALCGDVMMGRGIDQLLPWPCEPVLYEPIMRSATEYLALAERVNGPIPRHVEPSYPWGDALPDLQEHQPDARIVNLETSVTRCATPAPKGINYRMSPENFASLLDGKIDCCVLANNHVLDWGEQGLIDTLHAVRAAGIASAGAGLDLRDACAPGLVSVTGKGRVLVYACAATDSGVPPAWRAGSDRAGVNVLPDFSADTARRIGKEISASRKAGDLVVASIHWGDNWGYAIPPEHRRFAHALVDAAGADLIHGHSSHHAKGIEVYRGRLILYGCGDLISDYEGIEGYEAFRDDLVLLYLPQLRVADGMLVSLTMLPYQLRKFRLNRAAPADRQWLRDMLDRESRYLNASITLDESGCLQLRYA